MNDHTTFGDAQEEQAQQQMVDYGVRMRKERDIALARVREVETALEQIAHVPHYVHVLEANEVEDLPRVEYHLIYGNHPDFAVAGDKHTDEHFPKHCPVCVAKRALLPDEERVS